MTTQITLPRARVEQAIAALESRCAFGDAALLRAALTEQVQPAQGLNLLWKATHPDKLMEPAQGEREAFEEWIAKDGGDLRTFGSGSNIHYSNGAVNQSWTGWKARAALLQPNAERVTMRPEQVRDGIADWVDANIKHREFWTPEVVELIRSIEINGGPAGITKGQQ